MKKNYIKKFLSIVFIGAIVFSIQSCARKMSFATSTVVPAAEGSVKIKKDKNKNYTVNLKVIRLSESRRLNPPKQTYVVWMKTDNNGTKNIGSINTSSSLFSKTLKSSLQTVTPFNPEGFFITAEDDAAVQYPQGIVVLTTR
jgi:hypothetical protein